MMDVVSVILDIPVSRFIRLVKWFGCVKKHTTGELNGCCHLLHQVLAHKITCFEVNHRELKTLSPA